MIRESPEIHVATVQSCTKPKKIIDTITEGVARVTYVQEIRCHCGEEAYEPESSNLDATGTDHHDRSHHSSPKRKSLSPPLIIPLHCHES
ncbi:hypothetical protein F2Q68_00030454 [Brassica cretica]|uniref:Uncharacterized protein n=1 Tax=Brassica cretica TaxID=69181 RepID=A0A8S9GBF4_BRACR|nr:hypothetical protein F2Q68_00030454 [Brassica cretica]